MSADEVMAEVRRDAVFYDSSGGGVTFTGGEPMMQADFLFELASAAHAEGIHVAVDTSGFAPWTAFERMLPVVDLFLYDLKCIDSGRNRELTGVENRLVLENLLRLDSAGAKIWIRCPLVPGLNDSDGELSALKEFVRRLRNMEKLEICPYHPLGVEKYAKFGKPLLYGNKNSASGKDVERWNRIIYCDV